MQLFFIFFISIIAILEFVVLQSLNKDFQKQKALSNIYKEKKQIEAKKKQIEVEKNFDLEQQMTELQIKLDKEIEQHKATKKELTNAKRKITNLEQKIAKK